MCLQPLSLLEVEGVLGVEEREECLQPLSFSLKLKGFWTWKKVKTLRVKSHDI
jgi:hypothetical protein